MKTLLQIVHPHTFKLIPHDDGLHLTVGENDEGPYGERDRKVATFMEQVLKNNGKIIVQHQFSPNFIERVFRVITFEDDPLYSKILKNETVLTMFTAPNAIPILDEPKEPEGKLFDAWKLCRDYMRTHCEIKYSTGKPDSVFFIGGALETCLGNFATYHAINYSHPTQKLFYVPELCPSFNWEQAGEMKSQLEKNRVKPINYEEALKIITEQAVA